MFHFYIPVFTIIFVIFCLKKKKKRKKRKKEQEGIQSVNQIVRQLLTGLCIILQRFPKQINFKVLITRHNGTQWDLFKVFNITTFEILY